MIGKLRETIIRIWKEPTSGEMGLLVMVIAFIIMKFVTWGRLNLNKEPSVQVRYDHFDPLEYHYKHGAGRPIFVEPKD